MNIISPIQDFKPVKIIFPKVPEEISHQSPLVCVLIAILQINEEKGFVTAKLADSKKQEVLGFFYGETAEILNQLDSASLPISIVILKGRIKNISSTQVYVEIHHVILDNFTFMNSSSIGGYEYCETQSFLDHYFTPYENVNVYMFWGNLIHDYLAILFEKIQSPVRNQRNLENEILSAFYEAMLSNWQYFVVLNKSVSSILKEFKSNFLTYELEFINQHLLEMESTNGEFEIFCEKFIRSPILGLQGRIDRLVLDKKTKVFSLIETKTGRSKRSSQAIAYYQGLAYTSILQDLYGWSIDKILIEFPRHPPEERMAIYPFPEMKDEKETNFFEIPEFLKILSIRNQLWAFTKGISPKKHDDSPCGRCSGKNACDYYKVLYPEFFEPKNPIHLKSNPDDISIPQTFKNSQASEALFGKGAKSKALLQKFRAYDRWFRVLLDVELESVNQNYFNHWEDINIQELKGAAIGNLQIFGEISHEKELDESQFIKCVFTKIAKEKLHNQNLRKGDYIYLSAQTLNRFRYSGIGGIITYIDSKKVEIQIEKSLGSQFPDPTHQIYRIDKSASTYMIQVQKESLDHFLRYSISSDLPDIHHLRELLFFDKFPKMYKGNQATKPLNSSLFARLDVSQQKAVATILNSSDMTIIQGPPGTGKTTVIIEIIHQFIQQLKNQGETPIQKSKEGSKVTSLHKKSTSKSKNQFSIDQFLKSKRKSPVRRIPILVSAYTNKAVDNIIEKLLEYYPNIKCVRIGNIHSSQSQIVNDFNLEKLCATNISLPNKHTLNIIDPLKVRVILDNIEVVAATTTTISGLLLSQREFELVILDEAGQVIEPAAISALIKGKKYVLVGDHKQLPPIVAKDPINYGKLFSIEDDTSIFSKFGFDIDKGLEKTLFERLVEKFKHTLNFVFLAYQYRMNHQISGFISSKFYDDDLLNGIVNQTEIAQQSLKEFYCSKNINTNLDYLPKFYEKVWNFNPSMIFIDTHIISSFDSSTIRSTEPNDEILESKYNLTEVDIIRSLISTFTQILDENKIKSEIRVEIGTRMGVISAYRAQNTKIAEKLESLNNYQCDNSRQNKLDNSFQTYLDEITIDTVDRFQGSEREIIIYSFVDSNPNQIISRLNSDPRRLNVAISRAKKKIIFIGNSSTLTQINAHDTPEIIKIKTLHLQLLNDIKANEGYLEISDDLIPYPKDN